MARPHIHPSANCYRKHGCRCPPCHELWLAQLRTYAPRRTQRNGAGNAGHGRELSPEELAYLRRLVGLQ